MSLTDKYATMELLVGCIVLAPKKYDYFGWFFIINSLMWIYL